MNRYSLLFALLVASTFAVRTTSTGDAPAPTSQGALASTAKNRDASKGASRPSDQAATKLGAPAAVLETFLNKAQIPPNEKLALQVLFFTVPHPLETHLAGAFDHNVDALQTGLQDAGYLFDSSWIPWHEHAPRGSFDDDSKERTARDTEDQLPGILLFRRNGEPVDSYCHGLIVFLISEKPTEGIALSQVTNALGLLNDHGIPLETPIHILGPTFSGSLPSLGPVVQLLHGANPSADFLIRSGGLTGGAAACREIKSIAASLGNARIDFGSAQADYPAWNQIAESALYRMGIRTGEIAILSENESSYGWFSGNLPQQTRDEEQRKRTAPSDHWEWNISFPRDISSLRTGYEQQGIFNTSPGNQPWDRFLNLKSDDQNEGDSIRSFGGTSTTANQEAILFGISEFLKFHDIRAVIISATNEEDRLFLTQFLHAHNSGVRVVLIGNTRLMMRGSMAQFRGDLAVDDFPMFPLLQDWTGSSNDRMAHVFADDVAEGTFFAAMALIGKSSACATILDGTSSSGQPACDNLQWPAEYAEPNWNAEDTSIPRPPMYVLALGTSATWPVAEQPSQPFDPQEQNRWQVAMPFSLWPDSSAAHVSHVQHALPILVARGWSIFFLILAASTALYVAGFWFADPVRRSAFASFSPSEKWRFWLFKALIPSAIASCAFRLLAWAVAMPADASPDAFVWWRRAETLTFLAPLSIAASAIASARMKARLRWMGWMFAPFLPAAVAGVTVLVALFLRSAPFGGWDVGSILNSYREIHWESGLSLLPTGMLFLLAFWIWTSEAGNGAALLEVAPPLPDFPGNQRISQIRATGILSLGQPFPGFKTARALWVLWASVAIPIAIAHFSYPPLTKITTLESAATTRIVLLFSGSLVVLMLLDAFQFLFLWKALRGLLHALDRQPFRRSFVPIDDFRWKSLWSFTGISFEDRRAIDAAMGDCILELYNKHTIEGFKEPAKSYSGLLKRYSQMPVREIGTKEFADDRSSFLKALSDAGNQAALLVAKDSFALPVSENVAATVAAESTRPWKRTTASPQFLAEKEEVGRLAESQQAVERLLCLMYIGFIQTIVARLHTLLLSIAFIFSLVVLGFAIYPFAPATPLMICGLALLIGIGWAFFKVFSEMDTDPILSRIVDGDDRKLQGNFYMKFAEAISLPLLALVSSLLPGGAGRILELAQVFLSHTQ